MKKRLGNLKCAVNPKRFKKNDSEKEREKENTAYVSENDILI